MPRSVSLPMYFAPKDGTEAFWRGLRRHLVEAGLADVPLSLAMPDDRYAHWLAPDLLCSQTCGYPLATSLAGRVQYVGTPCYRAEGCEGPLYSSVLVVRFDDPAERFADLAGRRAAFNSRDSQSGMNALRALAAPLATAGCFFGGVVETGAHRASVAAVQSGRADVAAIDAVTYALLSRDEPESVASLRILGFTGKTPGLPLITARATPEADVERLRAAWFAACADPALATARAALLLDGFAVLPLSAYDAVSTSSAEAAALGYPELA